MNAPERIWTTGTVGSGSWNAAPTSLGRYAPETEYIRADLFAALTAEVEALRKREAEACTAFTEIARLFEEDDGSSAWRAGLMAAIAKTMMGLMK